MKNVTGFDGYYVSDDGKVWSEKSKRFLKSSLCNSGYKMISLCVNGMCKRMSIHRMVASAYIDNPENKRTVNHIDGDKTNNHVDNLEWATYKENSTHSIRVLGNPKPPTMKGKFGHDHNRSKEVFLFDANGLFIKNFGSISEAGRELNVPVSSVHYCCSNRTSVGGYFVFKEKIFNPNRSKSTRPRKKIVDISKIKRNQ